MKRQMAFGLALTVVLASTMVDAQIGGLIRKKAGEVVGGKKPAPAPTTAPAPATTPPTATEPAPAPAAPAATAKPATPAAAKDPVSPLETSALPVRDSALHVLRGDVNERSLPGIPPAAVAAAYALSDSAQAALVDTVGAAIKALVMSPAFLTEHNTYIQNQHKAIDHGLKGVVSLEDALKKQDLKAVEAIRAREYAANIVNQVQSMSVQSRKFSFTQQLAQWKADAAQPKRSDLAKRKKMVAMAEAVESLPGNDEKFIRTYAVILAIDNDLPDTEAALFALAERANREREQLAYDQHNLQGQLKQQLTTFVAIASKVNFKAPTVEKGGKTVFVNAADERQGAMWKACFRAGEAPTAAAIKLARAWLAEL